MKTLSNLPPGCSDADIERHATGGDPCGVDYPGADEHVQDEACVEPVMKVVEHPQTDREFFILSFRNYVNHPHRRAIRDRQNTPPGVTQCSYLLPDGRKCIIGQWFTVDEAIKADDAGSVAVLIIQKRLPEWMLAFNEDMMSHMQDLHDTDTYWDQRGLSATGKAQLHQLAVTYFGSKDAKQVVKEIYK